MGGKDFTKTFRVDQSPEQVFQAINDVPSWWSGEVEGETTRLGGEFTYRVPGIHYSRQRITEFVPGSRVVWRVTDARLEFASDPREWKGTDIVFEISRKDDGAEVYFTHRGLVSAFECYDKCSNAWSLLVGVNLRRRITTGEPQGAPW